MYIYIYVYMYIYIRTYIRSYVVYIRLPCLRPLGKRLNPGPPRGSLPPTSGGAKPTDPTTPSAPPAQSLRRRVCSQRKNDQRIKFKRIFPPPTQIMTNRVRLNNTMFREPLAGEGRALVHIMIMSANMDCNCLYIYEDCISV